MFLINKFLNTFQPLFTNGVSRLGPIVPTQPTSSPKQHSAAEKNKTFRRFCYFSAAVRISVRAYVFFRSSSASVAYETMERIYSRRTCVVKQYLCCTWSRHQLHFLLSPHCLKSTYDLSKSLYACKSDQVLSHHQMRPWKIFANPFKNIMSLLSASQYSV